MTSRLVIDVGLGMLATTTIGILTRFQNSFVVGVDPNPICLRLNLTTLSERFSSERYALLPYAIVDGPSDDVRVMYVTANDPGCSSLYEPTLEFQQRVNRPVEGKILVRTRTLRDIICAYPCNHYAVVDFLKIDVQGSDLAVIRSGAEVIMNKVAIVCIEADGNDYIGSDANLDNIESELGLLGFTRDFRFDTSDATFVNSRLRGYARDAIAYQR
jgi:FkbM family methyltransferase